MFNNKKILLVLMLSLTVFLLAGCSNGLDKLTNSDSVIDSVTENGKVPVEDSKLAAHAPRQLIVKVNDPTEFNKKLKEINAKVVDEIKSLSVKKVILPEGASVAKSMEEFQKLAGVEYANPNYLREPLGFFTGDPNDNRYDELWGIEAINASEAWSVTTGSKDVVIAVIDTGVQADHPDLAGKVLQGFNVYEENDYTADEYGHGTHVAGIAAGIGNNGVGIAGLAWDSPILPIKVFQFGYPAYSFEIAEAITWLVDWANAHPGKRVVANMSLGGYYVCNAEKEAIDSAVDKGIVITVAMGNDGHKTIHYPAKYNGVIAVGATNGNNEKSEFSSEGEWISVAAPGSKVLSSVPYNDWDYYQGTSMATPYVAGAAALVLAKNPDYTPAEVKSVLENTAQDLGPTGYDTKFGHGLINVGAALNGTPDEFAKLVINVKMDFNMNGILEEGEILPYAEVTLRDENGSFVDDELTDSDGKAVFTMLDPGIYTAEVTFTKSNEYYGNNYLSGVIENLEVVAGETTSKEIELEFGVLLGTTVMTTIENTPYYITNYSQFDIMDVDGDVVFKGLTGDEIAYYGVPLKPGDYILKAYDMDSTVLMDFEKEKEFTIEKNSQIYDVEINGVSLGMYNLTLTFKDEDGNEITEPEVEVRVYNTNGEHLYTEKGTYIGPVGPEFVKPGTYILKISVTKQDDDWPEADLVGYIEKEVTVSEGDIAEIDETITLKQ